MPFIASGFDDLQGHPVGSGHCVPLVRECAGLPPTAQWRRGERLKDGYLQQGTCIATFDADGRYGNHTDGRSHAAIYLRDVPGGVEVFDQWVGKPAGIRVIRDKSGAGPACDDASRYHVIELAPQTA